MSATAANKVVLITGATAFAFAKAGAKVVIAARGAERGEETLGELQRLGADARFVQVDVSDSAQVQTLIRESVTVFGRLDCAVNNAAAPTGALSATADFTEQEFDQVVAANLKSVWLCLKYEIRQLLIQQPVGGLTCPRLTVWELRGTALSTQHVRQVCTGADQGSGAGVFQEGSPRERARRRGV